MAAGVRFRTAAVAVIVVGVVLVLVVVIIGVAARARLESSIRASVETRVEDLVALIAADGADGALAGQGGDLFAQVVGEGGLVLAFSPGLEGLAPVVEERPPRPGTTMIIEVAELFDDSDEAGERISDGLAAIDDDIGPHVVGIRDVAAGSEPITVIVGASLEPARRFFGVLQPLVAIGLPVVLGVVGILVWRLTGATLRPVDAMRSQAESISARALDRRLPEPASRDELHALASTLNEMLDRLEASATAQRRFVADASHELKTPVASMRTMLEVATRDADFADWDSLISDLARETHRSEALIRDLLTLASFDESAKPLRMVEVDLDQVVGSEADALRRRVDVRVDVSAVEPVRVLGDPEQLGRLVANLLDNAARHADDGVWAGTTVVDGWAVIEISDDGPGIAPQDRERVFDRFVRLDDARARHTGGTGLGLAVARAVARSHGGDVAVLDPRRHGATLQVKLPIAGG
jgi:signal transduction histidine kinase